MLFFYPRTYKSYMYFSKVKEVKEGEDCAFVLTIEEQPKTSF